MSDKKWSAAFIADLHIRETQPICRTDDFQKTVWEKIDFIGEVVENHNIPLIIAGDIFHHWKPSPGLLRLTLEYMPSFIAIPGQHDLPQHNIDLYEKSGLAVLEEAGIATVLIAKEGEYYDPKPRWGQDNWLLYGFPYGVEPTSAKKQDGIRKVCLIHELVTYVQQPFPTANAEKSRGLLNRLKGYDLIVSGDNHQQFTYENRGRRLINPGSVFRTEARQAEHQPKMFLWSAEDNSIMEVDIPVKKGVVTSDHIDHKKELDNRTKAYIEKANQDYDVKLSYVDNLKEHMIQNKSHKRVQQMVLEDCEKEK